MTINEVKQKLLKWINSCNNVNQLDSVRDFIGNSFYTAWDNDPDFEIVKSELINALAERKRDLIWPELKFTHIPTLDCYLQSHVLTQEAEGGTSMRNDNTQY